MNLKNLTNVYNLTSKNFIVKGFAIDKDVDGILFHVILYTLKNNESTILSIKIKDVKWDNIVNVNGIIYKCKDLYKKHTIDLKINSRIKYNDNMFFLKPIGFLETKMQEETDFINIKYSYPFFVIEENIKEKTFNIIFKDLDRFFVVNKNDFIRTFKYKIWVPDEIIVHSGKMHADDIMCAALIKYINKNVKIIRTRNIPDNFTGLVADVGEGRYDHHNLDKVRTDDKGNSYYLQNGELEVYSAFGLLAKDILPGLIEKRGYFSVDHNLIRALDANDNYGINDTLSYMFSLYNPLWNSDKTKDECFLEAVDFGVSFIERIIKLEKAKMEAIPYINQQIKKMTNNILVLEYQVPWKSLARTSKAIFVIYPTDEEEFAIQAVPDPKYDIKDNINKQNLPNSWLDEAPNGMIFCHKALHFATFDTFEHAYNAALTLTGE